MKKFIIVLLVISLFSLNQIVSQEKKAEKQKKDAMENFLMVDKTKPIPENLKVGFNSINGKDAMAFLNFLASDSLEGRETASLGYLISAEFIATLFSTWGLKPAGDMPSPSFSFRRIMNPNQQKRKVTRSYFQQVEMKQFLESQGSAKAEWRSGGQYKAKMFTQNVDYQFRSQESQVFTAPVVFVGYGISEKSIKFDEYKGLNVKGKIVMMLSEYPGKGNPKSPFEKGKLKSKYNPPRMRRSRFSRSPKSELAKKKGAIAIIMVENSPDKNGDIAKRILDSQRVNDENPIFPGERKRFSLLESGGFRMLSQSLPSIRVSNQMASQILKLSGKNLKSLKSKIEKEMKPSSGPLKGLTFTIKNKVKTKLVRSPNVLGYIEGSDPELKKEVIVIGAHLDHLGKRGDYIFNGADDNGSGSAAVMEIAQAFALNPEKPKRTVLFALWTGEEKGLLGSRYYVSRPYFPLDKTIANLNLDMVSRIWDPKRLEMMGRFMGLNIPKKVMKKIDISKFMALSYDANFPGMKKIMTENNQYVGLSIFLRPSKSVMSGGGGSDHMPFGMKKIPWIFFASAITKDYHQPTDSIEKVSEKLMQYITRLSYLTAVSVANR